MEIEIENEKIHLKKGIGGWRVIHPINLDGKINWFNLITGGSWFNLIKTIIIILILLFLMFAYLRDIETCRHLIECGARCPEVFVWN